MPYVGQSVADLFGPLAQAATEEASHAMCETAGETLKGLAKANTPVESGKLREAWNRTPVVPGSFDLDGEGWSTDVFNNTDYAGYVENGTGLYGPKHAPYIIRPKNPGGTLRWVGKDGQVHFAKFVVSPGSPGNYMLAIAMNVTESLADEGAIFVDDLAKWVEGVERTASH